MTTEEQIRKNQRNLLFSAPENFCKILSSWKQDDMDGLPRKRWYAEVELKVGDKGTRMISDGRDEVEARINTLREAIEHVAKNHGYPKEEASQDRQGLHRRNKELEERIEKLREANQSLRLERHDVIFYSMQIDRALHNRKVARARRRLRRWRNFKLFLSHAFWRIW